MIGIYKITNIINNKMYIGQSKNIETRWLRHKSCLNNDSHENSHLQYAWNKYGEENFEFTIVEECELEKLNEREIYWISVYDAMTKGYNLAEGGNGCKGCKGYKHTSEGINKMRQAHNAKKVVQLDLNMNYIKTWYSAGTAGKALGYSSSSGIQRCCEKDKYKSAYGYIWIYESDYLNNNIDYEYYTKDNPSKPKRVSQYDLNMNLIKVWNSGYEIHKELGYKNSQISSCCNSKKRTAYNFIWRFTDEYTEEQYIEDSKNNFSDPRSHSKKKVNKYSLSDEFIQTYDSLTEAAQHNNIKSVSSIIHCCNGKYASSGGFKWKYAS